VIWGRRKAKILFARHLDNPNHLEPPHEFSFFAHAVFAPKSWSSEATLHKNELICPSSGNSVWSVDRKKNRCVETPSAKDGTRFAFAPGSHHLSWGYTASYAFGIVPIAIIPESRPNDARTALNFPSKPFVTLAQRVSPSPTRCSRRNPTTLASKSR
jgi:hypothetical protein